MRYLLNKNYKHLEPRGNFKLRKLIKNLTKNIKKLVALSLLAVLSLATSACCANKKPESSTQKTKSQIETLGIDEGKAFFVTPSGKATNDGSSWQKAKDLQSAIDAAAIDATKKFVLVAGGSYYADPNKIDIAKNFILKDGVKIYGGFDVSRNKLTRYKNASILEGELKAKEGTNAAIHSKLILIGENLSATSILDGFLIQNALNADYDAKGGGLYLNNSKPQLNNLTFSNNKLTGHYSSGGAIYNTNKSKPSISNSSFRYNYAKNGGGAISNFNSSPGISNSTFSNNSTTSSGGAIANFSNSNPNISNGSFSNNSAYYGGAIYNNNSSSNIINSSFKKNSANHGGTIFNNNSSPSISNSIFNNNFANYSGAIYNYKSSPKIYNSILWNNIDKHKGIEAINNIYNFDGASQPIVKNSILSADSAVTKKSGQYDNSVTDPYNFMASDAKFKANQTPSTFSIDEDGKVASANQGLIKDKGDNVLYLEIYDKIKGSPANTTTKIPSDDKDLAANPRLSLATTGIIDIGAYELQE